MTNGSEEERVMSLPRGPISCPTLDLLEPERPLKEGTLIGNPEATMRLLLGRTSLMGDSTNIPPPEGEGEGVEEVEEKKRMGGNEQQKEKKDSQKYGLVCQYASNL